VTPELRARARRALPHVAALLLLAAGGALWGGFLHYTHVEAVPREHRMEWSASWISPPDLPLVGYYRKEIVLPSRVRNGWVAVSAPFSFSLFVNGVPAGGTYYKSALATDVFDITRLLNPGTNVIALTNTARTYGEHSRIVVEGEVEDWSGRQVRIRTDGSWKALNHASRQLSKGNRPYWYDETFDDTEWPRALDHGPPAPGSHTTLSVPPWTFREPIPAVWSWHPDPSLPEAFFRGTVRLRGKPRGGWVRVAARSAYTLLVNDHVVTAREGGVAVEGPRFEPFDLVDVTPYLERGENVVALKVRSDFLPRGLALDGVLEDGGGTRRLDTASGGWQVSAVATRGWTRPGFRGGEEEWVGAVAAQAEPTNTARTFLREVRDADDPPRSFLRARTRGIVLLALLGAAAAVGLAWLAARRMGGTEALPALSLAVVAPALLLALAWLVGYDHRADPSVTYRGWWVWGAALLYAGLLASAVLGSAREEKAPPPRFRPLAFLRRHRWAVALLAVMLLAFGARLHNLGTEPFGADEIKMLEKSRGVLRALIPNVRISEEIGFRPALTSELVHYPMAVSILAFGDNEFGLRLPGVLFAIFTIPLLYRFGQMLHSRAAGLMAGAAFAFLPDVIRMSQLARYPSQLLFFTVLTVYLWWRCLSQPTIRNRFLWAAMWAYLATYFSWEGSGFLLPCLFLGMLVMRPHDLGRTLRDAWLLGMLFFVGLVVLLQLNLRYMITGDLFTYGTGTAELTLVPTWFHSNFLAFYYVENFFLVENHQILFVLALAGIPLLLGKGISSRGGRYLAAIVLMNVFMKTCFLQIRNWRYLFNQTGLLCLAGALALFGWAGLLRRLSEHAPRHRLAGARLHDVGLAFAVAVAMVGSTSYALKLYELPGTHGLPRTRLEDRYYPTIREAVNFVQDRMRPGDVILSPVPHLVNWYVGRTDYFLQTVLQFQVMLSPQREIAMHRVSGTPAILTIDELVDVFENEQRLWYITSPLDAKLLTPETAEFLQENMEPVYENLASVVYLTERGPGRESGIITEVSEEGGGSPVPSD
jgi:hypothetical protein